MTCTSRLLALALLPLTFLPAQNTLTLEQLGAFIKSSTELKQPDRQVAAYLRTIRLSERLDAVAVENLQRFGIGQNTLAALRALSESTRGLPAPKQPESPPVAVPPPPPSSAEQSEVIEKVREYALSYTSHLPDFICTQVTRRFIDPAGMEFWQAMDVITTRLSFFDQKEDYKVILVNNRPVDIPMERLGGTTSRNEFGTLLREIFERRSEAAFQWSRWATLRGRRMHVYSFSITQPRSQYTVQFDNTEPIITAYHGLVYVDRDSNSVMRIRIEPETPPSYPIQQISLELDYDLIDIGGVEHLLPLKHTLRSRRGRELTKNEVEFRLYRKFTADASISFDTPEALPASQTTEQPPPQK